MYDFQFKPFNEMTAEDYAAVGFMSGLEVHQQLFTEKKLFCRCPAGIYTHDYQAEILRHMRPTLSELGEYDGTALMEFKTKKDIIYRIHYDTVCTYEMDDTPPFEMNDDALDIAFEVAMLIDANIVDEVHIARKQYLDGSIPTGFQRTAITCVNGKIPYKDREIGIIQMSIEEDSCREESDIGHRRVYLTDRLGMPLIETVTAPDMKTPQEVADVNQIIRRLVRSTGHVRTGVGAGREDVNVSVTGGTRIEIKGVPSIKRIPVLTYNEAMRQWNLLRLREELHKRGVTPETFDYKIIDITSILRRTYYKPIHDAIGEGKIVKCVALKKFKGLLNWQTQTDTYFSKEISDRVRVIACLSDFPNMIHSDSYENTLSTAEGTKIRKFVGSWEEDTLVIVWGSEQDCDTAAKEIAIRAKEATIGIPSETRQALHDGTNGFERILPGPERMYPDTDLPPKRIFGERIERIRKNVPIQFWILENRYKELGLRPDVVSNLSTSKFNKVFDYAVDELKLEPMLVSIALTQFIKRIKREGIDISALDETNLNSIFKALSENRFTKDSLLYIIKNAALSNSFSVDYLPTLISADEFASQYNLVLTEINSLELYNDTNKKTLLLDYLMKKVKGRIAVQDVISFVNENFKG
ncbi:MAG: Glu-tRNA(Gln) amidotransferase subunit GatE [Candidatus Kapabacteria bacterium]|nr:Glu-tRNA(Gln) amidotransferase subunit GatE [Candidatus Kapabacteria bacterium]